MMAEMEKKAKKLSSKGKKTYIIPGGVSNAIGAMGYAAYAEEIMNQLNYHGLSINHIIVPSGSAGTHAGMVVGMTGTNAKIPISGINVSRTKDVQGEIVYNFSVELAKKLGVKADVERKEIVCFDTVCGTWTLPFHGLDGRGS